MNEQSPPQNLRRTVVRGVGLTSGGALLKRGFTLAVYVVLARLASPATFGTFAEASVLVWFGGLFVESGMTAALIHRRDRVEEAAATALFATLAGGIGVSALCAALAPVVGLYFHSHQITIVAAAVSAVHLLNAAAVVPEAMLQRRFSFLRRTVVDPITVIVYGATAAAGLATGLGVWALALAVYASESSRVVLIWTLGRWRPDIRRASWRMWRELVGYARHVLASEFLRQVGGVFNTAAIGRFVGKADLAQYNFGFRLATEAPAPMVSAVAFVLFPALARISTDADRFRRAVAQSFRTGCFIAFPVSAILVPLGEPLSVLLLGERWRLAGRVVAALAAVGAGLSLRSISTEVFKAAGRPEIMPRVYGLSAALPALAVIAGIRLGVVAIAGGVAAALVGVGLYAAVTAVRVAQLPPQTFLRALFPPTVASAAMIGALYPLEHLAVHSDQRGAAVGLSLLGTEVLLGGAIYVALVYVLDAATVKDVLSSIGRAWGRRTRPSLGPESTAVPPASG